MCIIAANPAEVEMPNDEILRTMKKNNSLKLNNT